MKKVKREDPLKLLGELASALESEDFLDNTSAKQRRALRETADGVRDALLCWAEELTPPLLLCFYAGATAQVQFSKAEDPVQSVLKQVLGGSGASGKPSSGLTMLVAYLARDLLAGERVE